MNASRTTSAAERLACATTLLATALLMLVALAQFCRAAFWGA